MTLPAASPRPMDVPLEWSQTRTYVRKIDGYWWVAWAPFVDTMYAMGQVAGIVAQGWWCWFRCPNHEKALEAAIALQHRSIR